MRKRTINVDAMTVEELDRLYAECEDITPDTPSHPMDKADRAFACHAHNGGRPRIGAGAQRINITVERGLLKQVDAFARKIGVTRAALVAEGLRKLVSA